MRQFSSKADHQERDGTFVSRFASDPLFGVAARLGTPDGENCGPTNSVVGHGLILGVEAIKILSSSSC